MKKLSLFAIVSVMVIFSSCGGDSSQIDELRMPVTTIDYSKKSIHELQTLMTIDYSKSIDDLVIMGNYYVHVKKNLSKAFAKVGQSQEDTIITHKAVLLNFNRSISSEDVVAEMVVRGLRPATAHELLALGHAYPKLQGEVWVVALGSKTTTSEVLVHWNRYFDNPVTYLWSSSYSWSFDHWFLAFPIDS